jgi:hypothetical protein
VTEELLREVSNKLSVLISLQLKNPDVMEKLLSSSKRGGKGTGQLARYLNERGISALDISKIVGSPVASVRTLLTPKRMKSSRNG